MLDDDDDDDSYEELSHSIQILMEPNDRTSERLDELLGDATDTKPNNPDNNYISGNYRPVSESLDASPQLDEDYDVEIISN